MSDERLQILKMLEEGKVTASEAAELLEALQASENDAASTGKRSQTADSSWPKARWLRIEVQEQKGDRVHIKIPLVVVKAALRLGGRFSVAGFDSDDLGPEVMAELEQALMAGEPGSLIDVVEEDGDHVRIFME